MSESRRFPEWMRFKAPGGDGYRVVRKLVDHHQIHTICQSALCPNIGECWDSGTATFLILGDICTRACRYCNVISGRPLAVDCDEPTRVADAVKELNLSHAVITSVNRDDLPDGGAELFAATVKAIREISPQTSVEVLIPDFDGNMEAVNVVLEVHPDIFNHNIETVPNLFPRIRPKGDFQRSLDILWEGRKLSKTLITKSGIIIGMGETKEEIISAMERLREVDCNIITIGQYLRPSSKHIPVQYYYTPEEFLELRDAGLAMGFTYVESAPYVRSSYHAARHKVNVITNLKETSSVK